MSPALDDTSRLCIHTITTKPWNVEQAIDAYSQAGVGGITVWREALKDRKPVQVGERIRAAGLSPVSLCRGGFFPAIEPSVRRHAIDETLCAIDQAAQLGAPLLVLVCGADAGQPLSESRRQITEAIAEILPHASACGVRLGIEPLHPMYADARSAINTLEQANDLCEQFDSQSLGVVVDVYHLWWDPHLKREIIRCGQGGKLFAFHICDWMTPTQDLLYDRGLMGEGCIPLQQIRNWVRAAGFTGFHEVEIFSLRHWARSQDDFLDDIIQAYLEYA